MAHKRGASWRDEAAAGLMAKTLSGLDVEGDLLVMLEGRGRRHPRRSRFGRQAPFMAPAGPAWLRCLSMAFWRPLRGSDSQAPQGKGGA